MKPDLGIEPGPHWWEASALTTAPSLHPQSIYITAQPESCKIQMIIFCQNWPWVSVVPPDRLPPPCAMRLLAFSLFSTSSLRFLVSIVLWAISTLSSSIDFCNSLLCFSISPGFGILEYSLSSITFSSRNPSSLNSSRYCLSSACASSLWCFRSSCLSLLTSVLSPSGKLSPFSSSDLCRCTSWCISFALCSSDDSCSLVDLRHSWRLVYFALSLATLSPASFPCENSCAKMFNNYLSMI